MTRRLFRYARWLLALWILALPGRAFALVETARCGADSDCPGQVCHFGTCRAACTADADCSAGSTCVAGGCLQTFSVNLPLDYGLTPGSSRAPGCNGSIQCSADVHCRASVANPSKNVCVMGAATADAGAVLDCGWLGSAFSELCPFNFSCAGSADAKTFRCEDGSAACTTDSDCQTAYPIAGLDCLAGRCSSGCVTSADCCASPKRCTSETQTICYHSNARAQNFCAATTQNVPAYVYQLGNPNLVGAMNLVFMGDGFLATSLNNYLQAALKLTQFQLVHADMWNAILSGRVNVFILNVPDDASGAYGPDSLFGEFVGPRSLTGGRPGGMDQAKLFADETMSTFAATLDATIPATSVFGLPVLLANGAGARAVSFGSNGIVLPIPDAVPSGFGDDNFLILSHELGHSFGGLLDEYTGDAHAPGAELHRECPPNTPTCNPFNDCNALNVALRETVTDPPCSDCTPATGWLPLQAPWGELVNTSTFPTTDSSLLKVGIYEGGLMAWPKEVVHAQANCRMNSNIDMFCAACREGVVRNTIPPGTPQTFRFLDLNAPSDTPAAGSLGPHLAVAQSSAFHEVYLTRNKATGPTLTLIDETLLTPDAAVDFDLTPQLAGELTPTHMVIDEPSGLLFLFSPNSADFNQSRLVVFDRATRTFRAPLVIPGLQGAPVVTSRTANGPGGVVLAFRTDPTSLQRQLVTIDTSVSPLAATFSTPTSNASGLPLFDAPPVRSSRLVFFPAAKITPSDEFCTPTQCQIWAFFTEGGSFVTPIAMQSSGTSFDVGIFATNVGTISETPTSPVLTEVFVAANDESVSVWRTADVRTGVTTPFATFAHDLGSSSIVSAVAAVVPGPGAVSQVLIGNRNGRLASFNIDGSNAPSGSPITVPGVQAGMEVRDILYVRESQEVFAAFGGFQGPRRGLIAALRPDLSGADRVSFVQPTSAMGQVPGHSLAMDQQRSILFSNSVVDPKDVVGLSSHQFRIPLIRGFAEHRFVPSNCP